MKLVKSLFLVFICSVLLASPSFVFASQEEDAAAGATGCLGCFGGCGGFISLVIILNIALLVWVAKDAKNRKMDSPILWMVIVLFTGSLGLVLYLASRTKGTLVLCENCKGKKLEFAKICPHCEHKSLEKDNNLSDEKKKDM